MHGSRYSNVVLNMFNSSNDAAPDWSSICSMSDSSWDCGCWGGAEPLEPGPPEFEPWLELCQVHWYGVGAVVGHEPPLSCVYVGPGDRGLVWLYWYPSGAG